MKIGKQWHAKIAPIGYRLKRELEVNAWGAKITLPIGTKICLVIEENGGYAVADSEWLKQVTGNTHDPEYRFLYVPADAVEIDRPDLASWIIKNLLNESQLDVVPPGYTKALRHLAN